MTNKKRVFVYYDGSNFYHTCLYNYGIKEIDFYHMTNQLLDIQNEELVRIKYFNAPINQQENPIQYADQLKFFSRIRKTPFLELYLGRLVRRPLKKINIVCRKCGHQKTKLVTCPFCNDHIDITTCYKSSEKGVDVQLAINMLLDALHDKYDVALLFSGDADYCPAIRHIIKELKKEVIFCHFPHPKTNELVQTCSSSRIITKDAVERAMIGKN
ncbi:MAG TPA: NYN domain-containing protein [Candidatus Nanoarchaeia archaeon]|nr:NYN domain-containing protein [Candidatus Nanoarchaeia archaeon]